MAPEIKRVVTHSFYPFLYCFWAPPYPKAPSANKSLAHLKIMPHPVCLMHRGEFNEIASAHKAGEVYSQVPYFPGKLLL